MVVVVLLLQSGRKGVVTVLQSARGHGHALATVLVSHPLTINAMQRVLKLTSVSDGVQVRRPVYDERYDSVVTLGTCAHNKK